MKNKTKFHLLAIALGFITMAALYSDYKTDDMALPIGIGVFLVLEIIHYFLTGSHKKEDE